MATDSPKSRGASEAQPELNAPGLALFLLLPTVAMSLGWGLRGTIGGGQIGAMIPGAMVALCLCHLLGWRRSLGIVVAIGTVGVGLGGQETYGQTIGFLRQSDTVWWGLTGLALKGAMWGLSGGVLVGLGLTHVKYRPSEIANGMLLMIAATLLGWMFVDQPKLTYFSNRLDKPREEVWVGLTVGALTLLGYLALLNRERVSAAFAWGGAVAGGIGFGGGGAFNALGAALPEAYSGWSWWKMMEFSFGALYGLGLGAVCYRYRDVLREIEAGEGGGYDWGPVIGKSESGELKATDADRSASGLVNSDGTPSDLKGWALLGVAIVTGLVLAVGGLWLNFSIRLRAGFSVVAAVLILLSLASNRLAWHIALSITAAGFIRDYIHREAERGWLDGSYDTWTTVAFAAIPVVVAVALAEWKGLLTATSALLGMTWLATIFGLVKVGIPAEGKPLYLFVPTVFILEALATTLLVRMVRPGNQALRQEY